jgi:predicted permease
MSIRNRFKHFLRSRSADRDLAEEIETHRLMLEARLGTSAGSRRAMGNITLAREEARAVWIAPWLESVWQDVAYAFRVVRRAPAFAASIILVMALGIGATTGVFGLVDGLVLKSLPVHRPDRLVYFSRPSFSYPVFQEVRARGAHVLSGLAAWDMDRLNIAWNTELEPTEVLMASGEFHSLLGISALLGRTFTQDDDRIGGGRSGLVAVLSHAAWQQRFGGDPSVLGRTIRIEQHTFSIIGVTPPGFFGVAPGLAPEVTIPLTSTARPDRLRSTTSSWVHLLGRLRDGIGIDEAKVALQTFWPAVLEATASPGMPADRRALYLGTQVSLESARAGYSRVRNQFADPLWILFGLVVLLLTVACASAANLLLARGAARQREIAVRLAIGASRTRLVRQMLTESLVWTTLASAAGLLLAVWGGTTLVSLMTTSQETIVLALTPNRRMLLFTVTLALLTAAISSLVPALRATRLDPAASLQATGQIGAVSRRWSFGKSLVGAQVAVTIVLVFAASLFVRSLERVLAQDAGVDRQRVLVLATDAEAAGLEDDRMAAFYQQLLERLASVPGAESASLSMYPPISDEDGAWTQSIAADGAPVPSTPGASTVYFNTVSPGYFRTVALPLVAGRDFTTGDGPDAPRVAVVNESLARTFFPGQNALGRQITMGRNQNRQDLRIVGIVRDAKYQRMQEAPRRIAYLPHVQQPPENLFAEIRVAGAIAPVAESIRREVRALDAVVPMRLETITDRINQSLVTERIVAMLATALGLASLLLACAALYGLVAYTVARQTREIGLRLALGAERFAVLRTVMSESLVLVGLGIVVGGAAALWLGRYAGALLFQLSPRDPVSLVAAAGIMLLVACLAAFVPARRAARVDPVVALRE